MRTGRFAQVALLVAGFLAVSGSFGLHPEPERAEVVSAPGARLEAFDGSGDTSPHVCLACLAHRSISLPRLASVTLALRSVTPAAVLAAPIGLSRLEGHPREGRAPPALG